MTYDIIVRFPNKELADEFCGQMSDGFGEGFCDFSFWDNDPDNNIHGMANPRKVIAMNAAGTAVPVYFVNAIFEP